MRDPDQVFIQPTPHDHLTPAARSGTTQTPWELNRRFLDLIARSGTALFVSVDPAARTERTDQELSDGIRLALDGGEPGLEPLDWLSSTTPARRRSAAGEVR